MTLHKGGLLAGGRLLYAASTGAALVAVLAWGDSADIVGAYNYQAALASTLAVLCTLGTDRVLARRVAAGELPSAIPRGLLTGAIRMLAGIAGFVGVAATAGAPLGVSAAIAAFVATRVTYSVVEALWIASDLSSSRLAATLTANGTVTALGIFVGANYGAAWMTAASALGNAVGVVALMSARRLPISPGHLGEGHREAAGFAASAALAQVYGRVDYVILAALGTPLAAVGYYGIAARIFDAVGLIRGAIAQQESREFARLAQEARLARARMVGARTVALATVVSIGGMFAVAWLYDAKAAADPTLTQALALAAAGFVALPLFVSHLSSTALVFSDRRSYLLAVGSLVTSGVSILAKSLLIWAWGAEGAVLGLGVVELGSAAVFYALYARSGASVARAVVPPVIGAAGVAGLAAALGIQLGHFA